MSGDLGTANATRRQFLFGGTMIATSAAAYAFTPRIREAAIAPGQLEQVIPKRLGPWSFVTASGLVVPPPDETDQRSYDQVLTRVYSRPGDALPVMLLIAYGGGQSGLFIVHRPEACYPAQGYALSDRATMELELTRGRRVSGTVWSAHSAIPAKLGVGASCHRQQKPGRPLARRGTGSDVGAVKRSRCRNR